MNRPNRAYEMIRYLEDRMIAGAYSSGERLPSLRALMRKFKISYGTVRRGMAFLDEKHANFRKEIGRGTYYFPASVAVGGGNDEIAVFYYHSNTLESGLYYTALKGIISAAQKDGVAIRKFEFDPLVNPVEKINRLAVGCSGIILLWQYDSCYRKLALTVPAVGVMMENSFDGTISIVDVDPVSSAEMALNYFLARGLRRFKILSHPNKVFQMRGQIFAMLARERDCRCSFGESCRSYRNDTGYFFTSDNWAHAACCDYFTATGRELTDDHVIIGVDGKQFLIPEYYHFPTINVNWEQIGVAAYRECVERIVNPALSTKKIYLSGWLVNERCSGEISKIFEEKANRFGIGPS